MTATPGSLPAAFVLRRLHSLSGVVPLGAYFLLHTWGNSFFLGGETVYLERLARIRAVPLLAVLEWGLVYLPLVLHGLIGVVLLSQSRSNVHHYNYASNWRYVAQRFTGIIAALFIAWHVFETRLSPAELNAYQNMVTIFSSGFKIALYLTGTTALAFHFCNGLWNFFITWGVTVSSVSQTWSLRLMTGLFVALMVLNIAVIWHLAGQG